MNTLRIIVYITQKIFPDMFKKCILNCHSIDILTLLCKHIIMEAYFSLTARVASQWPQCQTTFSQLDSTWRYILWSCSHEREISSTELNISGGGGHRVILKTHQQRNAINIRFSLGLTFILTSDRRRNGGLAIISKINFLLWEVRYLIRVCIIQMYYLLLKFDSLIYKRGKNFWLPLHLCNKLGYISVRFWSDVGNTLIWFSLLFWSDSVPT